MRGEAAAFATLVLNGKLSVLAGRDHFRAEAGPWTVLGADALVSEEGSFVPDFSAHVATDSVRCVYVTRAEHASAWLFCFVFCVLARSAAPPIAPRPGTRAP